MVYLIKIYKITFLSFLVTSPFHVQLLATSGVTTAITVLHVMLKIVS